MFSYLTDIRVLDFYFFGVVTFLNRLKLMSIGIEISARALLPTRASFKVVDEVN